MYKILLIYVSFLKDAPEAPNPPQVLAIRHESAIVSWSDPKDTGGSPITGYLIFFKCVYCMSVLYYV